MEWTSTKERFPPPNETVLLLIVTTKGKFICSGIYCDYFSKICAIFPYIKISTDELEHFDCIEININEILQDVNDDVTHWMPIPEFPNEI